MIKTKEEPVYEFGKWAEKEALKIISQKWDITEMNPSVSKYSPIDGIIFKDNTLHPIQIKTRSPRALYRDISLPMKQWKNYQDIANKNPSYTCFMICDMYNPQHDIDYKLYSFEVSKVKYTEGGYSNTDGRSSVFIKLRDMNDHGSLNLEFQKELERKHIEMIRPQMDTTWLHLYKNKF